MTGRHEAGQGGHPAGGATPPGTGESADGPARAGWDDGGDQEAQPVGFGFRILPAGWMRGLLFTVTAVLTVGVALSDLTSAWVMVALPGSVVVAVAYLETLDRITRP
jgi:hypothetical protein